MYFHGGELAGGLYWCGFQNQDRSATDGEGVKQGCRKGTIYKEAMKTGKDGKITMHADGKRT